MSPLIIFLASLGGVPTGLARADASPNSSDEEYNFKWLDPDKKVYVLQNRKYRKALRPFFSVTTVTSLVSRFWPHFMQWWEVMRPTSDPRSSC